MELQQFNFSPRVHAQYVKALAKLSEQLNETWKRVFPPDALWPVEPHEAFFEPFAQFSVALYDAYAQDLLNSTPSQEHYLQLLNFDLKTLVCNRIYPYREKPVRHLRDALDADVRGELPGEWEVRMGHAWRLFEHPRHSAAHDKVRRDYIDLYGDMDEVGRWKGLIEHIHTELSRRGIHWLAAHAERAASLAEIDTTAPLVSSPESTSNSAGAMFRPSLNGAPAAPVIADRINSHGMDVLENWGQLTMAFISDERVNIIANGVRSTKNYAELGFADGRSGRSNEAWKALYKLAGSPGTTAHLDHKRAGEIRVALRAQFPLQADPLPYRKGEGYRPAFRLELHRSASA